MSNAAGSSRSNAIKRREGLQLRREREIRLLLPSQPRGNTPRRRRTFDPANPNVSIESRWLMRGGPRPFKLMPPARSQRQSCHHDRPVIRTEADPGALAGSLFPVS